jgi:putative FmdB family regulatory protein
MPTYEYRCLECKHKFEEFQVITDNSSRNCPICGGKAKRLISGGGGLIFKGSGFYATDYRNSGKGA